MQTRARGFRPLLHHWEWCRGRPSTAAGTFTDEVVERNSGEPQVTTGTPLNTYDLGSLRRWRGTRA